MNYELGIDKPVPSLIPFSDDRRPYPQFVGATFARSDGRSNYDSLSFNAERRVGWVAFDAHWTWSHGMSDYLNVEDPYGPRLWNRDLRASPRGVQYRLGAAVRTRPAIHEQAHKGVDEILGGWRLIWVSYMQTGQFFSPSFSDTDPSNTNSFGGLPDRVCNGNLPSGQRTVEHWFDTSCFVEPPPGRFGNSGVNVLEGPGLPSIT